MKRYFRKTRSRPDANQTEIVEQLRMLPGVEVYPVSGLAFDIVVGWRGKTYLYEIKSGTKKKLKPSQEEFSKKWTGHWMRVNSAQEIMEDLAGIARVTSQSKAVQVTLRSLP